MIWQGSVADLRAGFGGRTASLMPSWFQYKLGESPRAYAVFLLSYLVLVPLFWILRGKQEPADLVNFVGGVK